VDIKFLRGSEHGESRFRKRVPAHKRRVMNQQWPNHAYWSIVVDSSLVTQYPLVAQNRLIKIDQTAI